MLPLNAVVTLALHESVGAWWVQGAVLTLLGFALELIGPGRLSVSGPGALRAAITFIVFGAFVLLGTPWAMLQMGLDPFGLRVESMLLPNVGALLLGVLTAKALFTRTTERVRETR